MRRRMFFRGFTLVELIGVVVILGLIALVALPPILNSVRKTKGNISDASQKILYSATEVYVSENINSYPRTDGNVYCIAIGSLVSNNLLPTKVYDAVTGEEIGQDNIVEVTVNQGQYSYSLNNNCVEKKAVSLIQTLLAKYSEGATNGLVNDTTDSSVYYFKGSNSQVNNNYLWYGGHQWRVMEFDTDTNILTLITSQPLTSIQPASAVWTTQSAYENSYINKWLNDYFYNSLASSIQNNIVDTTFNVGIYTNVDEITTTQKVGLLDYAQYERAGTTGYLYISDSFWSGNRYDSGTLFSVADDYMFPMHESYLAEGVRPVIRVNDIGISSGDGTLTSNYITETKAAGTSNVQVGEYINVPTTGSECGSDNVCTFRVVSKDNDSIKVVLNGLLTSKEVFGNSTFTNNSSNNPIYASITTFANSISGDYRYSENKTFYIGTYSYNSGVGYENVKSEEISLNVGLPVIGEMFSGNDIDMGTSTSKSFVDINTIENATVSHNYWTMNAADSSGYVTTVLGGGTLSRVAGAESSGVRPVIFLNSNLTFTGGNGTAQNPYTLT